MNMIQTRCRALAPPPHNPSENTVPSCTSGLPFEKHNKLFFDLTMQRTANQIGLRKCGPLGNTHILVDFLGEGGFGVVTKCISTVTGTEVAIKVNKNRPHIFNQARREIEILKRLRGLDPDTCNIVKWNGFFFHKENICLNFELLDKSLHDYRVHRRNANLSMRELRPVIHQLATALSHLSSKQIVHADLKPENVMVVDSTQQQIRVRLIDFGLAHPRFGTDPGACVQTTWYRAPEVIIQLPFDEAIDMWSLGLTIVEMPPDHMLDSGVCTKYYFATQNIGERHPSDKRLLLDLIKRMLELDPVQRIKPLEVLQHPFLTHSLEGGMQTQHSIVSSVCKARPENVHHGQVVSLTDESESKPKRNRKNSQALWLLPCRYRQDCPAMACHPS
uniref:Protein kinase domain-containing protein n=1 Tax=Sparus aurata TaxID=8175 RepID=A0A671Y8Y4_SPAAU